MLEPINSNSEVLTTLGDNRDELAHIATAVGEGKPSPRVSVRKLLGWFNAQRRGFNVVQSIRKELKRLGIETVPDFNDVWIDSEIAFKSLSLQAEDSPPSTILVSSALAGMSSTQASAEFALVGGPSTDPMYRIGKLPAANKEVVSITANDTRERAITLMLAHEFSQLPVMQGERDVKGVVSWQSMGSKLALGLPCDKAHEFMVGAQVISSDRSMFEAIEVIAEHQYVLVQGADRKITGIVTSADLSFQFRELSEPFLLLGEIEQHIRTLISGKFTPSQLKDACDPMDADRTIQTVADLTMGEYIRLLENPLHWGQIGLKIERSAFVERLQAVRRIRNDVMHFEPDPLSSTELSILRLFARFMQSLRDLGAVG